MSNIIEPTVGRVVHFYPNGDHYYPEWKSEGPWKADIVDVHNERLVNVAVFDPDGEHHTATSIPLVQPGDDIPQKGGAYVTWMPYQVKGKATGSESGEKAAGTQQI